MRTETDKEAEIVQYARKRTPNRMLRIAAVTLGLTWASFWMVCNMYARYSVRDDSADSARVAAFVFRLDEDRYLDLSQITKPGDSQSYSFTVSNADGTSISEVTEEYIMEIQLRGSLPLVCTLKKEGTQELVSLAATTATVKEGTNVLQARGTGSFSAAVQTGAEYELTVAWPAEENAAAYANAGLSDVILNVTAQQAD